MTEKDRLLIKDIVYNCIKKVVSPKRGNRHTNYLIDNVPVFYQYEYYPLLGQCDYNNNYIRDYIHNFKGHKSVLDVNRRQAYDAAKDFFSYSILKFFGQKNDILPNLCLFPVPSCVDQASYYAEWNEVLDGVAHRTGARNCIDAFTHDFKEVYGGSRWKESEGLPDGFFSQVCFPDKAKVILLVDEIYRGTQVRQTIDILRDLGCEVVLVLSLSQVII